MADTPAAPAPELTVEYVEKVREILKALPELDKGRRVISRTEAVGMLKDQLLDLRSRGYSVREIAAVLTQNGIRIAKPTLTACLTKKDENTAPKKIGRKRTKKADTNPGTATGDVVAPDQVVGKSGSTEFRPADETPKTSL